MVLRLLLTAVVVCCGWGHAVPVGARPHVVVVLADDMGWADWEHGGGPDGSTYYETPHLDRLAAEGVTFTNAYASSPTCSPTRAALLTGESPGRSHFTEWLPGLPMLRGRTLTPRPRTGLAAESVTLAEALRDAGYRTALVGKWHLGLPGSVAADPSEHGFDVAIGGDDSGQPVSHFADGDGSFRLPGLGPGTSVRGAYLTDRLTDIAVYLLEAFAQGPEPFFLFVSHYAVHTPIEAPADVVAKYRAKPPCVGQDDPDYAAMVDRLDVSVGRILDQLERLGLREDTVVVFTSDNGGLTTVTSNAPLRHGKGSLHEGGVRVPLIVSWPGNPRLAPGSSSAEPNVTHDLYPTLLDLTGTKTPTEQLPRVDGVSLAGVLEGWAGGGEAIPIFWHLPHVSPGSRPQPASRFVSAVRVGDWKAIYGWEDRSWRVYDLANDPGEWFDLHAAAPEMARSLGGELRDWLRASDVQRPFDGATGEVLPWPQPVPEPHPVPAAGLALLGVALRRRLRARPYSGCAS